MMVEPFCVPHGGPAGLEEAGRIEIVVSRIVDEEARRCGHNIMRSVGRYDLICYAEVNFLYLFS